LLLLAVWCAWVYTSWITSWFDPDRMEVRLLLVGLMLASLVMSATLPEAFDDRGLGFASAHVMIQVGRTVVVLLSCWPATTSSPRTCGACSCGWCSPGALGGRGACPRRGAGRACGWWLPLDYTAPLHGFSVPGLGRSRTEQWTIEGGHLAERCQPVVIVAPGASPSSPAPRLPT
jgi:low temperature requirement protein LtrA